MATKALHLEIVSDLTTKAFLNSLKRLIARRGKPRAIFSDNGRNFVGADNLLKKFCRELETEEKVHEFLSTQSIEWRFNPPQSPHMGGLWESAVKSCKTLLRKSCGELILSFEELSTLISQIEAILNSRPLIPLTNDPSDLSPLTPGHFLIGRPLTSVPEPDWTDVPSNRLNRYQVLEQVRQSFWKRWSSEYLVQLQRRVKWTQIQNNVTLGAMVILKDDDSPPLKWKVGRITKTYFGKDNLVRVVDVKTADGTYKRPVTKMFVLPTEL